MASSPPWRLLWSLDLINDSDGADVLFFSFRKPHPLVDFIGLLDYFLPVGLIGTGVRIAPHDVVDQPIWPAAKI